MNVTLREITSETVVAVVKLAVNPDQKGFVATNAVSLSQALFSDEAWYRAVYADDQLVGFVMLSDETLKAAPPAEPNIGLWRLMIDAEASAPRHRAGGDSPGGRARSQPTRDRVLLHLLR